MSARLTVVLSLLLATPAWAQDAEEIEAAPATTPSNSNEGMPPVALKAHTNAGWDTAYGILFSLNNIFVQPGILSSHRGLGFGAQYHLTPTSAIRLGLGLSRATNPVTKTRTTTTAGGTTVTTFSLAGTGGPTESDSLNVAADYLIRLTKQELAPYVGGGVRFGWSRDATKYTDDVTVTDQTTRVDDSSHDTSIGVEGVLGVEWRLHERFSFYAEYMLGVDIARWLSTQTSTVIENSAGGTVTTTSTKSQSKETRTLNYNLFLAQGASLGVIAHF